MRRMLAWALILVAHAAAADPRSASVRMLTFPNGVTALLAPDSLAGAAHVGVWYDAGARNDPAGRGGEAYVLAAAALAPAADVRRSLEATGASFDMPVTADYVGSTATVPSEQLAAGLSAVIAGVAAPTLTEASLRAAIEGARAQRAWRLEQSPLLPGFERACEGLFAGHGYAGPPAGRDSDLAAITLEAARADLADRFAPAHALVTVAGRFDSDEALGVLASRFGAPSPAKPAVLPPAESFGAIPARIAAGNVALSVPVLLAAWRLPPDRDPDSAALEVLARVMVGGSGGTIQHHLVTGSGAFLQIQGGFERRRDACLLTIAAALHGKIDTATVESQLVHEVERWGTVPIAASELEPAQRVIEAGLVASAQSAGERARMLASAQLVDGDWRAWEQRVARVHALTPDDIARAARRLMRTNRTFVWTAPAPPAEGRKP